MMQRKPRLIMKSLAESFTTLRSNSRAKLISYSFKDKEKKKHKKDCTELSYKKLRIRECNKQ